ncbi:MAG: SDR family oxidoreductase [Candidatus Helarchaeota archaeon]|nr:SDR family oxidoreductase [Candidatus Helarchaeota archaeon]
MNGKICLITGANSGIGKVAALELAKLGAKVVMFCRNPKKGVDALAEIKEKSQNNTVDLMFADLASLDSVRQFAVDFKAKYKKLHILINNAGVHYPDRKLTVDGYEAMFAINHLGHFLLTMLLLDVIKASAPARIINVSSEAHVFGKINFDDLNLDKKFNEFQAYGRSKLANIYFTYELAERLEGTGVTVNCLHPGMVRTNFQRYSKMVQDAIKKAPPGLLISPEEGAKTTIYLATSSEVENVTGKYFENLKAKKSSRRSYEKDSQQKLWELSEKLTGLA